MTLPVSVHGPVPVQARTAVWLSRICTPRLPKLVTIDFQSWTSVPRRRSAPAESTTQFPPGLWPSQPITVTLQNLGFERGEKSKPFSLLSPSNPLLPAMSRLPPYCAGEAVLERARGTDLPVETVVAPSRSSDHELRVHVAAEPLEAVVEALLAWMWSIVVPRPMPFMVKTFSSLSALRTAAGELDADEAQDAARVVRLGAAERRAARPSAMHTRRPGS